MAESEVFRRLVRDALASLYDPIHLQTHPLIGLLDLSPEMGESQGEALRRLLWESIEELRPRADIPVTRTEWIDYRLLWLHFVQAHGQAETCRELGIGERSFYRRKAGAIDAVASVLWDRHRGHDVLRGGAHPGTPVGHEWRHDQARQEAVKVARDAGAQPVELGALLQSALETIEPLARQRGIRLVVHVPEHMPEVHGDPAMLRQIVLNVFSAGLDLACDKTLGLTIDEETDRVVWRLDGVRPASNRLAVADQAGALSVSDGLLRVYGGRLWNEPCPVRADCWSLCFSLPLGGRHSVLIIDDDATTVDLYTRYLERRKYAVHGVRDMAQMEATLRAEIPDIILLDVLMPQQDGWRFLQRLKSAPETAAVPVIICSVLEQPSLALALGAVAVLQKPISEGALLTAVEQALAP